MNSQAFSASDCRPERGSHWMEYRIGFAHQTALAQFANGPLPALLEELHDQGQVLLSFFSRKQPGLRLRVQWASAPDTDPVSGLLSLIALSSPLVFHPPVLVVPYRERALFGGEAALDLIDSFFDADSRMVLALAAGKAGSGDPRAVSVDLIGVLFRAAALDQWEVWSMWQDLAALRGGPSVAAIRPKLLPCSDPDLLRAQAAAQTCATKLRHLAEAGQMSAPLRAVMPVVAAYHLNRMGFDAKTQAALATGAACALAPVSGGTNMLPLLASVAFERVALGPALVFDLPGLDACIHRRDVTNWRDLAVVAEISLLRHAVKGPMRTALQCKAVRPLADAPAILDLPPKMLRKHDRRTIDTVLNLVWRHCANPVPLANLAATRVFDPRCPSRFAHIKRRSAAGAGDVFAADRYDTRPAEPLPCGFDSALGMAASAFSASDAPCPAPAQIALAQLLDRIGKGLPMRLIEADIGLGNLAADLGMPPTTRDPLGLAHALGLTIEPWQDLPDSGGAGLSDLCPPAPSKALTADHPRRVAVRLRCSADGVQLVYFGADRMCWLARYVPRDHPMERSLRRAASDWLALWPETLDATTGFSNHPLDNHVPLTLHGACLCPQTHWLQRRENGLYDLTDFNGRTVHAVHFGVSAPASLHPVAQLALQTGARLPSWGEWVLGAWNQCLLRQIAQVHSQPSSIAGLSLGGSLLMPGCACVLPANTPSLRKAANGEPQQLWDQICTMAGPRMIGPTVVRRLPGAETRVLDLRLPSGLRSLARMAARPGTNWLMIDPLPREADATPAREHYIELAAFSDHRHLPRTFSWTSPPRFTSMD